MANKMYPITSVCKGDMKELWKGEPNETQMLHKVQQLSDADMKWIAKKMADQFCNCCYWLALKDLVENIKGD